MADLVHIDTTGIASLEELNRNLVSHGKQVRQNSVVLQFFISAKNPMINLM